MARPTLYPLRESKRVYCAGPLFNEAERREMLALAEVLSRAGFEPFVPHADGMEFSPVLRHLVEIGHDATAAGRMLHEAIFALDVYQVVVGCGSLVFNMNGRVPDEGGVAELTMAWMLGKPVVIFKEDARSKIAGRDNPLLVGQTEFDVIKDLDQVGEALVRRWSRQELDPFWKVPCPPHLESTLAAGGELSDAIAALDSLGESHNDHVASAVADVVLRLFVPAEQSGA